eukprot:1575876-Rhodomonas_salina.2
MAYGARQPLSRTSSVSRRTWSASRRSSCFPFHSNDDDDDDDDGDADGDDNNDNAKCMLCSYLPQHAVATYSQYLAAFILSDILPTRR